MKARLLALTLLAFCSLNITVLAEKYVLKSHTMLVEGTSTLHDWKVPVEKVSGNADITLNANDLKSVSSMYIEAIATSMKSEKGESMDEKIYETLKTEDHPKIVYKLSSISSITKTAAGFDIASKGSLTIAGSTQPCEMLVKAKVLADGSVEFTGSKDVKLSQFDMDRPSAMLGMIKCGDDIKISFTVVMKK